MEKLTKEQKEEIIKILEERGVKLPCPRCRSNNFTVLDGYFVQTIQTQVSSVTLGGTSVPSVVIACQNCGYLIQHALGALGLLPEKEQKNEK